MTKNINDKNFKELMSSIDKYSMIFIAHILNNEIQG